MNLCPAYSTMNFTPTPEKKNLNTGHSFFLSLHWNTLWKFNHGDNQNVLCHLGKKTSGKHTCFSSSQFLNVGYDYSL